MTTFEPFRVWALALCILLAGCTRPEAPLPEPTGSPPAGEVSLDQTWETSYLVDPATGFGKITASSTPEQLEEAYGPEALSLQEIHLGEGEVAPGAVLFERKPPARVELVWTSPERQGVARATVRGESSDWSTAQGITLGTELSRLQELNGKPFKLTGFGWDYGGTITSWEGGQLEALGSLRLRVGVTGGQEIPQDLLGDHEVASDAAGMAELGPRVTEMTMDFQASTNRSQ